MHRIGVFINISLEHPNRQPSPTQAPGSPLGVTGAAALAEAELDQFHTLYEEYEMNLLLENDSPMSLNLALPPISIPEFSGEFLDWPRFHDLFV